MENRLDTGIPFSIENKFDNNGFLSLNATPTKVGVFTYQHPDGTVTKEFRSEEEVFKEDSLNSLKMKPVTLSHPDEMLNPLNISKFPPIGSTGENIKKDGENVECKIVINKLDGLQNIFEKKGLKLSSGYKCDVIP